MRESKTDIAAKKRSERLKKRDRELRLIIQKIVEQNALGEITKTTFADLYSKYNAEYETVSADLVKAEAELSADGRCKENAERFVELVRKYTACDELRRETMLDLIEKIVVHEATGDHRNGTRQQVVEFHYRFIGQIGQ